MGKKKGKQHADADEGEGAASQSSLADFMVFPSLDGMAAALPEPAAPPPHEAPAAPVPEIPRPAPRPPPEHDLEELEARHKKAQATEVQRLPWTCVAPVPRAVEDQLLAVVIRWPKKEIGMMREQPGWRVDAVSAECRRFEVSTMTALSLRRHHMTSAHKGRTGAQLRMGSVEHISGAAAEFESAVASYLDSQGVAYITEAAQKKGPGVLTPDFRFSTPVEIGGQVVNWLEAKQFYGAATINQVLALPHWVDRLFQVGMLALRNAFALGGK